MTKIMDASRAHLLLSICHVNIFRRAVLSQYTTAVPAYHSRTTG